MGFSDRYRKTFPITWDQLHRDAKALAWRLIEQGTFQGIVAITRGGLVPAAIIARELNIRMIDTVCVVTYDWQEQNNTETVLKGIPGDHFAAMYAKPAGKPLVDSFVTEVSQDTWILFPWDSEVQYAKPIADLKNE